MLNIINILCLTFGTYSQPNRFTYYNDPRIHNFGNTGLGGKIHAFMAPYATKMIDSTRYNNIDLRQYILSNYDNYYYSKYKNHPYTIDMCCGVGMSTHKNHLGIDTSKEMINKANILQTRKNRNSSPKNKTQTFYKQANAEDYGTNNEFDTSIIMFSLHEMPKHAQKKIVLNAKRIAKNEVLIMDISPNYKPSSLMLSGEPYLINYKRNIETLLKLQDFKTIELIPNHVSLWHYKKN